MREARLPAEAASAQFTEALWGLDDSTAEALIQERAQFYGRLQTPAGKPKSKGPPASGADHRGDVRRWARLVT